MKANLQESIFKMVCILTVLGLLPFSVYRLWHQHYLIAFIEACLILSAYLLYFYVNKTKRVHAATIFYSLVICSALLSLVYFAGPDTMVWFYPVYLGLFRVLKKELAVKICSLSTLVLIVIIHPQVDTIRLVHTILSIGFVIFSGYHFALVASKQNDMQESRAMIDSLTGVQNRAALDQKLIDAVERFESKKHPTSVMMLSVDDFAQIVEEFGSHVGDQIIKELASSLSSITRIDDEVYRYRQATFVVYLDDADQIEANVAAQRISSAINSAIEGELEGVTITYGVTVVQEHDNYISWLSRAEDALASFKSDKHKTNTSMLPAFDD